jgi:hypothetical protein
MYQNSTWSNAIEKGSYMFFGLLQESMENALEKYNNWELPEEINNEIINVNIDIENNEDENTNEESEDTDENTDKENVEVFTQSEKNDIQEILNILE